MKSLLSFMDLNSLLSFMNSLSSFMDNLLSVFDSLLDSLLGFSTLSLLQSLLEFLKSYLMFDNSFLMCFDDLLGFGLCYLGTFSFLLVLIKFRFINITEIIVISSFDLGICIFFITVFIFATALFSSCDLEISFIIL